jgi:hypothetical protein
MLMTLSSPERLVTARSSESIAESGERDGQSNESRCQTERHAGRHVDRVGSIATR